MSDDLPTRGDSIRGKRGYWRERDLQRALAVAKRARLDRYRVEIAVDGTISIMVGFEDRRDGRRRP